MHVFTGVTLISVIVVTASGVVYKPCQLVEYIKNVYFDKDASLLPYIVCIAGYRRYNTSYKLENVKNNTGYYGIFGLHNADINRTDCAGPGWNISNFLDDNLENDLHCLKVIVLDSELNMDFYKKMCSPSMVRNIPCPITNYVQADVFDPIDKYVFDKAFKNGGLPTPKPSDPQPTTPTTPCCCGETDRASNYWAFYITIPAILIVLAYFAVKMVLKRRAQQDSILNNA